MSYTVKPYPFIDPIIFKIGFFELRWYSLAYIFGFIAAYFLFLYLNKFSKKDNTLSRAHVDSLINYCVLGVIIGGRMGFVLFYEPLYFANNLIKIFAIWEGGMSFHGGLCGVILSVAMFCKKNNIKYLNLSDKAAFATLPGLFFGRLANFINGELWGKPTNSESYGFIFASAHDTLNRHPSQLYEAFFEGLVIFITMLVILKSKDYLFQKKGFFSGLFLTMYSIFRFLIEEFFREPDGLYKILNIEFSTGQILCLPMFVCGIILIITSLKIKE